jgi:putative transcriptional regulator
VTDFGKRLQELRQAIELSQPGLAARSGVPVGTIRVYEQGRREPSLQAAFKLARALGVSVLAFVDDAGQAEPPPAKKARKRKGER